MGIIFVLSTDFGSTNSTNALFIPIIKFFVPEISRRDLVITLVMIRKGGHIISYGILSVLWFNALHKGEKVWSWGPVLGALGISICYGALDELHQAFVESRTGVLTDVGFDSFGAVLGLGIKRSRSNTETDFPLKTKYFGWWFAWGFFTAIMALIVLKGGNLPLWGLISLIQSVGTLTGTAGVIY
ncbi:MAG: VanZ family protein, partial [Nitrospiria bacterium]